MICCQYYKIAVYNYVIATLNSLQNFLIFLFFCVHVGKECQELWFYAGVLLWKEGTMHYCTCKTNCQYATYPPIATRTECYCLWSEIRPSCKHSYKTTSVVPALHTFQSCLFNEMSIVKANLMAFHQRH